MFASIPISLADVVAGFFCVSIAYVIGGIIVVLIQTGRAPKPWQSGDFNQVKPWLSDLLRRGYDGGTVLFTHKDTDRSIGFRKYIQNDGDYGLELFVLQPESLCVSFPRLKNYCEEHGLAWRETEEGPVGQTSEVFTVDCAQDVERAFDVARAIWTRIFGLSTGTLYEREASEVSPHDELVDSRHHPRISADEIRDEEYREATERVRRDYSMSPVAFVFGASLPILSFLFIIIALPIAALFSMSGPADWVFSLGGVTLSGSTASLILLFAYCLSFFAFRWFKKWLKLPKSKYSRAERLYGAGGRVVALGLPIAVVLVWAGV